MKTLNGVSEGIVKTAHAVEISIDELKEIQTGTALLVAAAIDNASADARGTGQGAMILIVTREGSGDAKPISEPQESKSGDTPASPVVGVINK